MSFDEQPYSKDDHDLHDACEEIKRLRAKIQRQEAAVNGCKDCETLRRVEQERDDLKAKLQEAVAKTWDDARFILFAEAVRSGFYCESVEIFKAKAAEARGKR